MAAVTLTRKKFEVEVPKETDKQRAALARRASEELGYEVLAEALENEGDATERYAVMSKIQKIFDKLEIEPLDGEKIQEYKKNKLRGGRKEWAVWEVAEYGREIPEFALSRALEVNKAMSAAGIDVNFFVEELRNKQAETPRPDPFLFVEVDGFDSEEERIYLDVWDEPEFEGRRTV